MAGYATRILIVDPHAIVRRGVVALLKSLPSCEVVAEADSQHSALMEAEASGPDIAIIAHTPPEFDGLDLCQTMTRSCPKIRQLLHLQTYGEAVVATGLEAGAKAVVLKSDPAENLTRGVEVLRLGRTYFSPGVSSSFLERISNPRVRATSSYLTPREAEVLRLVALGYSNTEVSFPTGMRVKTVDAHRSHIKEKLDLRAPTDLIRFALRNEIIDA